MRKKDFIRIINEEITKFDFLSNDKHLKEQEDIELLENERFQKQFIIDSITKMRDKIKVDSSDSHIRIDPDLGVENQHDDMKIESNIEITYQYAPNKQPMNFFLSFSGDRINYSTDYEYDRGDYHTPPYSQTWYTSISWNEVMVDLYSSEGDLIDFEALDKAPTTIYELFVRSYLQDLITKETDISTIREKLPPYKPF